MEQNPGIRKKNDCITVEIEDFTEDGAGVGRLDGYIWFIKDTVIGDVVRARVMKMKKTYGYARLEQVIRPSDDRIVPACPSARQCGGCQLQAMRYEAQLEFKANKVLNHLKRIGGFEEIPFEGILGMEYPWRYRNKALFPFGTDRNGEIVTGFYAGHTHTIIPQRDCLLGIEENPEILSVITEYMKQNGIRPYREETQEGLVRHVLIRKGFQTGELMVCLVINGRKLPAGGKLVDALRRLKGMTSISFCVNTRRTNVIMGSEVINLWGPGYITDRIGGVEYRISPLSFYQINPVQTEKLYSTVLEYADLTGRETVWDLYCGIGTISLFLARNAARVLGVEVVPQAVRDARDNAARNGLTNTEFFEGKAEEVLPEQYEKNHLSADVIIVDPPRKGCGEACLETIARMAPEKVVYVSCDSATLARDLKYLRARGYELSRVKCCDFFAQTGHVETVVLMSRIRD